jgi:integrase/recombinase XerD
MDRVAKQLRYQDQPPPPKLVTAARDQWLSFGQWSIRTKELYERAVFAFANLLPQGITRIEQIESCHISQYLSIMLSRENSSRTANSHLTALKSFCSWYSNLYHIPNPTTQIVMLREKKPKPRFLGNAEFCSIMVKADPHTRNIFQFLANTGLRATEFCELRWSNAAYDLSSITFIGKGGKTRTVPLNHTCREILNQIPKNTSDDLIFLSKSENLKFHNQPFKRRGLYRLCKLSAKRCGIQNFGPHSFRHWFATQMLLRGVPIFHVSLLLGHASVTITQRHYAHILPGDISAATECLTRPITFKGG